MKIFVAFAFLAILASLGGALYFMMRGQESAQDDQRKSNRMMRVLALRVGLSIVLFICILIAWKLGWVQPTGIAAGR
jgi:TRAP-type C4-dicarboxylate transport system permease large subunit